MRRLEEPFSLSKVAVPTFMLASAPRRNTATTAMATLPVPSKPPSTLNTLTVPKPQTSSQTSKSWPRCYTPVSLSAPVHSDWSSGGELGWNKAKGKRENQQDYKKRTEENNRGRKKKEKKKMPHYINLMPLT